MGSVQSSSCETSSVQSDSCQGSSSSSVPELRNYDVDEYLKGLAEDGVVITVLEIGHYREPFQSSKKRLMHDFVGLRVRVAVGERLIKAEKLKKKSTIWRVKSWETDGTEIKHGPVGVEDCGEIAMGDLLAILEDHSSVYSLYRDNCWLYADSTFRRLIRNFSAHPTISPEKRSELKGFLNHPAPTMPFYVLLHSFLVSLGGIGAEVALFFASIGAAVLVGASAVAQISVILKSPTVQNFLRDRSATVVRRTLPILAPAAAEVYKFLSAAASSAPAILSELAASSPAVAATGCPFYWPIAIAIGVSVVLVVVYQFGQLALEALPRRQQRLSRRRTGPSMPLL
ncbi:unnamed protein product [Sphagnum tenellum]